MSTAIVLTPVIIAAWPAITAAVAGAAAGLGLSIKQSVDQHNRNMQDQTRDQEVEVELSESEVVAQGLKADQEIVCTKGEITFKVRRDARGRCVVCAEGKGHSKVELKQKAEEFARRITQCFVYNKVMKEIKQKHFNVVNEEVMEDKSIRINVRRWVD